MTTQKEALRMALEALDALCINDYSGYELGKRDAHLVDNALTAIKEALAQPEPDSVAYQYTSNLYNPDKENGKRLTYSLGVAQVNAIPDTIEPLYTHPKEWQDLTDEEIAEAVGEPLDSVYLSDFRRVIAKLKEKNT